VRHRRRLLPLIGAVCLSAASTVAAPPADAIPSAGDGGGSTGMALGGSGVAIVAPGTRDGERAAEGGAEAWAASPGPAPASPGSWLWPVQGPVVRPFDAPEGRYGPGHRGIDIAAEHGVPVVAPADGVVTFAGQVGGHLFVTIDHGGGLRSTCSWVSALAVRAGDLVRAGQEIARTGWGHPGAAVPHLHFGVRLGDTYVDPLPYLGPLSVVGLIRLAPLA